MMRWAILCSIVLGVCSILSAAGPSPYVLDAQATSRPDGKISVVAVIRSTSPRGALFVPLTSKSGRARRYDGADHFNHSA